jgi:general secretion pathway protein C
VSARADLEGSVQRLDEVTAELKAARQSMELAAQASAAAVDAAGSADAFSAAASASIRCVGETCTVDRAFVRKAFDSPEVLARQARVVPSVKDGVTQGFKLYGIRSGSLPKLFGLKNGDMLTSVNGSPLASMDQAMAAYTAHKDAEKFFIGILRKGAPVVLTVVLTDGGEAPKEAG